MDTTGRSRVFTLSNDGSILDDQVEWLRVSPWFVLPGPVTLMRWCGNDVREGCMQLTHAVELSDPGHPRLQASGGPGRRCMAQISLEFRDKFPVRQW